MAPVAEDWIAPEARLEDASPQESVKHLRTPRRGVKHLRRPAEVSNTSDALPRCQTPPMLAWEIRSFRLLPKRSGRRCSLLRP